MKLDVLFAAVAVCLLTAGAAQSATLPTVLDREFRYDASRIRLGRNADGTVQVTMARAMRDMAPGHADLPLVAERVDLPPGTRVAKVEVVDVETEALASGARIPSAVVVKPGLGPIERTAPDPQVFARDAWQPSALAAMGAQGDQRGANVAWLQVAPVRWNPVTGALERISRMHVRLTLEAGPTALERQRIVPAWEEGTDAATGVTRTATTASIAPQKSPGRFVPTQLPSVLGSPVEYVIVTNDSMASQFQRLADWKTQTGVPAVVRTMSFIHANYPFGADDAERVRMFIRDAYTRWGTKWVLLGGDTDVIPVRLASTSFYGGDQIATDLYYSCLDGNWNADGDSLYGEGYASSSDPGDNVDLLPEVYVGRAPSSTPADAQQFVNKSLQYEKTPVGDYEKNLLFFAEVLFPQDWQPGEGTSLDGAELIEEILPMVQSDASNHYARLYQNYTDARWVPGALPETRVAVIDSLDRGYNVAVHVGHGYRNVMSVGDNDLTNADAMALSNGNRLINTYAIDCTSNAIDFPCIGEAFLKAPNGGSVTNIGSTRFDFPTAGREYQKEYFTLLYQDSITAIGQLQAEQKLPFVAFSTYDGVNRWTQMTLLLLGEPELHIWTGTPRTLQVTAPASLLAGDSTFAVHVAINGQPLYNATVTAYKPNDVFASVPTDGAGNALLPCRPDSTGSLTLTVTGYDCRPYQVTIPVVSGAAEALGLGKATLTDDGLNGTIGNADGLLDAGETVDLALPVRNVGGTTASAITGTLTTPDPTVTIVTGAGSYGTLAVSAQGVSTPKFRISVAFNANDQREIPFSLRLVDGAGRTNVQTFQLTVHAPDIRHNGHTIIDTGGNGDGKIDPGESISYFVKLRNMGTGQGQGITAVLRSLDAFSTVTDSTASFGDISAGQQVQGDAMSFSVSSTAARLQLVVSDQYGQLWAKTLDVVPPAAPTTVVGIGAASSISLNWAHNSEPDLTGYNIYRSTASTGPFAKVNPVPTDRIAYFMDSGLAPLTRYYYKVSAVDSSANESSLAPAQSASTNPPTHAIFPIPTGRNTPAPVAVDHIYTGYPLSIVAGSDLLYVWNPDGTAPVDADGLGSTSGDFTTQGSYYAAGPSIANLLGSGPDIVAPSWETHQVLAFDAFGNLLPGFPVITYDDLWSGVAIGDLKHDGTKELVTASRGTNFYAWKSNGSELLDGDNNAGTVGVFKVLGAPYNDGTPALAPLEGGSQLDIVFGSYDGNVYAWRPDGTNVPGFPVSIGFPISASVAVGYIDGPSDPMLDIVVPATNDSLYVLQANGTRHPGFPVFMRTGGTSKTPSPAIADMNNDGYNDIVEPSTNGYMYVWNRTGVLQYPWNVRYSTLTNASSESSPVVADINGDGVPDVVMGDENGQLTALSGVDGSVLPGFPIQLSAEVKGTPALCDCDGDGKTEIVVADWDKNVYVWDYDFPFSPGHIPPWPQFHHDAERTGYSSPGNLPWAGVDDGVTIPRVLSFAAPEPNPTSGGTHLSWEMPASHAGQRMTLAIYDLSGRRVHTLMSAPAEVGRHELTWDLRTDSGSPARAGVFFARLQVGSETRTQRVLVIR
ncbi:MAG TPA: C25 family cysteine peptidase [Candidatus Eisenbacteria bacterium]|nr:C25 family cysteine peptidase [Candidatus Eisenbacteria bacterium]